MTTVMNGFVMIRTPLDAKWYVDGDKAGWDLPDPVHWLWRKWPFRAIRAYIARVQIDEWDKAMLNIGLTPTGYDRWVIYAIRRGWC